MTMITDTTINLLEELCGLAFGNDQVAVTSISDAGQGRGAFSIVLRAELSWLKKGDGPASVVAKLPAPGPNGQAAIAAGAYRRELVAYRELLDSAPIATPTAYAIKDLDDGGLALLLEDLTGHRSVDQLDGLGLDDAERVAESLAVFHRSWRASDERRNALDVRRNTVAGLASSGLEAGLACLETVWANDLSDEQRSSYRTLVTARPALAAMFDEATDTLCHGDPRADNLVFGDNDEVVLFDWQQMAVQFGEADLAWLAATSIDPELRRTGDQQLVSAYGGSMDRYRLGLALPGLAVLFLAQRQLTTERTRRFIAVSLQRIATAITDLDVAGLAD